MKLHESRDAFGVLLNEVSQKTGIRADILEKDYYITLLLYELSGKQERLPAYFKGGTALYKAIKSIRRFSEDIDLTVEVNDCSKSQGKKRLEDSANAYKLLMRTKDKNQEVNNRGSITGIYEYLPVMEVDKQDALQRFGCVKVESTSFTVSEPHEQLEIEPLIYTKATAEQKEILQDEYEVFPFMIGTIKMERIFADKLLAAEFYYTRKELFDVSKHLYDITVMLGLERIQNLIDDQENLIQMLSYKRLEEQERIGSNLSGTPFSEFTILKNMRDDRELEKYFMKMQEIYVFDKADMIPFSMMVGEIEKLNGVLQTLDENLSMGSVLPMGHVFRM